MQVACQGSPLPPPALAWMLRSFADHPTLARREPPLDWLQQEERARWQALPTARRQREWLLGRWTAKQLVRQVVEEQTGLRLELAQIRVAYGASGAPVAYFPRIGERGSQSGARPSAAQHAISLSHSGDYAFCALSRQAGVEVGVDIERIEEGTWQGTHNPFTKTEWLSLRDAPREALPLLLTVLWGAKEALLKAKGQVSTNPQHVWCEGLSLPPILEGWHALRLQSELLVAGERAQGWWALHDMYALVIVTVQQAAPERAAG